MKKRYIALLILFALFVLIIFLGLISTSQMTATVKHNFPIYENQTNDTPRSLVQPVNTSDSEERFSLIEFFKGVFS